MKKWFYLIIIVFLITDIFSKSVDPNHILLFPNVNGESGFIYNPSAYYLKEGSFSLGLHPFIFVANIGVIDLLELGINLDFGASSDFFEILKKGSINLKCGILKEEDQFISMAIGIERLPLNLIENVRQNEFFRSYLTISRKILDMNFNLGIKKNLLNENPDLSKMEYMFDISKILNETVLAIIEYDGEKYNVGFKISLNYNINVELFIKNINNIDKINAISALLKDYLIFGITYIQ